VPNLEVIPLMGTGLTANLVSGQSEPQLMGWNVDNNVTPHRATTIQYLKTGDGTVEFLTLFLPLQEGRGVKTSTVNKLSDHSYQIVLFDGRSFTIQTSSDPYAQISAAFD
jgi:hypothetical protein